MSAERPSLRAAIDAMCRSCIYDPKSGLGHWREQVAGCTCRTCPLYALRPVPRVRATSKAISGQKTGVMLAFRGKQAACA